MDFILSSNNLPSSYVAFIKQNEWNTNSEAFLILLNDNIEWKILLLQ